ncbi:MAG: lipo-like protein [SAR86 cluster bacterium]|uniref:Lipo-like protein n=1 Tax=SAR86 cluster bacterium TaxID=2030880 RepID=A0A2A4MPS3_9GAMM|nr:MAG: lipo-like protein [SAR86 cluster bacterium]
MLNGIRRALGRRISHYLSKSLPGYQRLDTIPIEGFAAVLRPGDILLVEGNTRISGAIKYLTQSSWSHACLYVGNSELEDCPDSQTSVEALNLLEADLKDGVKLVSLKRYADFNLRICRPLGLTEQERQQLIAFAKAKLGYQYDPKNIVDLMRYLIQKPAVPDRYRRSLISFGSGEPTKAICSTLIAESFQSIDYPILPIRGPDGVNGEVPLFYKRHFTHFTPRDFDLSPYFEIIKPSLVEGFDFHQLNWRESESTST